MTKVNKGFHISAHNNWPTVQFLKSKDVVVLHTRDLNLVHVQCASDRDLCIKSITYFAGGDTFPVNLLLQPNSED